MTGAANRYAGRVALVTGASRGIGLAIAARIVAEGGRVCITGRKQEMLAQAVAGLGGDDVAMSIAGSADDTDHQQAAVEALRARFGPVNVLVNNTGINPLYGPLLAGDATAMRKIVDVNVLGGLGWVRRCLDAGLAQGGTVVNIASVAGLRPARGIGFYGASKATLLHLTQQLALELSPTVRVNAVAPAVVRTRFAGALFEGKEDEVTANYPLGRLGVPEDVAGAVTFLASEDAAWITGHVLVVDGGLTLNGGI